MTSSIYAKNGSAYIPTLARTEAGYYIGIEPVEVVPISDPNALASAIKKAVNRGNPVVPTPSRANFPKDVILKYAKVKSISAFEKGTSFWQIREKDGIYETEKWKENPEGGWVPDPKRKEVLAQGTSLDDAVRRLVVRIRESTVGGVAG
jgi:hypothetical protein